MSKYEVSEKVIYGVCSLIGLVNSTFDWPICFIGAGIASAKHGNTRKRFESTIRYIGYGFSYRAKWLAAAIVAPFNESKSDELHESGNEDCRKCFEYLDEVYE